MQEGLDQELVKASRCSLSQATLAQGRHDRSLSQLGECLGDVVHWVTNRRLMQIKQNFHPGNWKKRNSVLVANLRLSFRQASTQNVSSVMPGIH